LVCRLEKLLHSDTKVAVSTVSAAMRMSLLNASVACVDGKQPVVQIASDPSTAPRKRDCFRWYLSRVRYGQKAVATW
jgi:hypothetical protein